ncbi:hypothetical protein QEN19_003929 [Hanseniaspora menglaensis]
MSGLQKFLLFNKTLITILLVLGNLLLLFLIIFSGTTNSFPINKLYLLQADTSNIPGALYQTSRWTFWGLCENKNGKTYCPTGHGNSTISPAYPVSPYDNFGTSTNIPSSFVNNRDTYYYLSRFTFVFVLLGLIFQGVAALNYLFNWCSKHFIKTTWLFQSLATLFCTAAAACTTPVAVMARNNFNKSPKSAGAGKAKVGVDYLAILWASCACSILLFFILGTNFLKKIYQSHKEYVEMEKVKQDALKYHQFVDGQNDLHYSYTQPQVDFSSQQLEQGYEVEADADAAPVAELKTDAQTAAGVSRNNTVTSSSKQSIARSASGANSKYGIKFFSVRDQKSRNDLKEEDESEY